MHVASKGTSRILGIVILVSADPAEKPADRAVQLGEVSGLFADTRPPVGVWLLD
jgi:hypothetical protein